MITISTGKWNGNDLMPFGDGQFLVDKDLLMKYDYFEVIISDPNYNNDIILLPFSKKLIQNFSNFLYDIPNDNLQYTENDLELAGYVGAEDYQISIFSTFLISNDDKNKLSNIFHLLKKYQVLYHEHIISVLKTKLSDTFNHDEWKLLSGNNLFYHFPLHFLYKILFIEKYQYRDTTMYLYDSPVIKNYQELFSKIPKSDYKKFFYRMEGYIFSLKYKTFNYHKRDVKYMIVIYFMLCKVMYEKFGDECLSMICNDQNFYKFNIYDLRDFANMIKCYPSLYNLFDSMFHRYLAARMGPRGPTGPPGASTIPIIQFKYFKERF